MELLQNKYTEGEAYRLAQEITNIRKLFGVHFFPISAIYLSTLISKICPLEDIGGIAGITHGSRNGLETVLLEQFLNQRVVGTDISSSASFFPNLIQHDMNESLHPRIHNGSVGFVFSNSWDHSNSPQKMFHNWISILVPQSGCLILEKQDSSGRTTTTSDPFAADDNELIALVEEVSRSSSLNCIYVGSLELKYIPTSILREAEHLLLAGTATTLTELEAGKAYLTDFSLPPNPRSLRHHVFMRSCDKLKTNKARQLIANMNSIFSSCDASYLESFLSIHPSTLQRISFKEDILNKVISSIILASGLKKEVFKDTRGDQPHERNGLEHEVEIALASE